MMVGRPPAGPLLDLLREHLELPTDAALVDLGLNRWAGGRAQIAALAPMIVRAAAAGDAVCDDILHQAGREPALLATTARTALTVPDDEPVPVAYVGGIFDAAPVRLP